MYLYYLSYRSRKVLLFESQFQFHCQSDCLNHFEKGLNKGLFKFDHSRINQVWSELGLWGLVGRTCPVELVRILCAFGSYIECSFDSNHIEQLQATYIPANFYTKISQSEFEIIEPILKVTLGNTLVEKISPFIKLEDRLVFGSYYTDVDNDPDVQFPKYCQLLEKDICLPNGAIQTLLARLFYMGFKIEASNNRNELTLAEYNPQSKIIRGYGSETTLFYVSKSKPVN